MKEALFGRPELALLEQRVGERGGEVVLRRSWVGQAEHPVGEREQPVGESEEEVVLVRQVGDAEQVLGELERPVGELEEEVVLR